MDEIVIFNAAAQEADWLHYYGRREDRSGDDMSDGFYDRMKSIGYTKKVIALPMRCACLYLTSDKRPGDSAIVDLRPISGPRDRDSNIFTALEYAIEAKLTGYESLIAIVKNV